MVLRKMWDYAVDYMLVIIMAITIFFYDYYFAVEQH